MEANMKALVSVVLLEKDIHDDLLNVWSYPILDEELSSVINLRSGLRTDTIPIQYSFSKFKSHWIYSYIQLNEGEGRQLSDQVQAFSVNLVATDFNPEKYYDLTKLMAQLYLLVGDPLKLLECFLSVFAKGSFNAGRLGTFSAQQFNPRDAYMVTPIKEVIRMFGEEIILLWSALIMKKRIAVVSDKVGPLLKLNRAIPLFVWHRQNWDILRPFTTFSEVELKDLKDTGVYCAGFTALPENEDLYDVLVDANNRSISVASHAKADFLMSVVHKDICDMLITAADNPDATDADIIKALALKTKDLLGKLEQLKIEGEDGNSYIDLKTLQNTKLPANLDKFLYAVATAEGMTAGLHG